MLYFYGKLSINTVIDVISTEFKKRGCNAFYKVKGSKFLEISYNWNQWEQGFTCVIFVSCRS